MLYRTHHHPFLYTFNPFSHSSLSPHFPSSSSHRLQAMECVDMNLKTADDFLFLPGDDFSVDELLDFSNGFDDEELPLQLGQPEEKELDDNVSTPPEKSGLSFKDDDFTSLPETEFSIPAEGLESLEWLSHIVEDSFPDYSLTGKLPPKPAGKRFEPAKPVQEQPCFATPVQTKARTKRARTGVRVWPVVSTSFTESSTSSSSSSSSSTTSFSPPNFWPFQSQTGESFLGKPDAKKPKRKPGDHTPAAQPRRCSHCGVTKTPQWRAGPLGSKTLCNACGVRFKSGRLLPEYRPACSPTFSSVLHSNNHRKVLEMRRKKESEVEAPAVHSF